MSDNMEIETSRGIELESSGFLAIFIRAEQGAVQTSEKYLAYEIAVSPETDEVQCYVCLFDPSGRAEFAEKNPSASVIELDDYENDDKWVPLYSVPYTVPEGTTPLEYMKMFLSLVSKQLRENERYTERTNQN